MVAMIMIFMEGYFLSFSFFHFFYRLLFHGSYPRKLSEILIDFTEKLHY